MGMLSPEEIRQRLGEPASSEEVALLVFLQEHQYRQRVARAALKRLALEIVGVLGAATLLSWGLNNLAPGSPWVSVPQWLAFAWLGVIGGRLFWRQMNPSATRLPLLSDAFDELEPDLIALQVKLTLQLSDAQSWAVALYRHRRERFQRTFAVSLLVVLLVVGTWWGVNVLPGAPLPPALAKLLKGLTAVIVVLQGPLCSLQALQVRQARQQALKTGVSVEQLE
ncbi:hypothetical protein D3C76_692830 [compost metagenome]